MVRSRWQVIAWKALEPLFRCYFSVRARAAVGLVSRSHRSVDHGMALVGHRGASATVPENTLRALQEAWDQGAIGAEFDLQQLADGQVVVLHDETLQRTASPWSAQSKWATREEYQSLLDRNVSSLAWEDVKDVDVGGEGLSRFADVLRELAKRSTAGNFCLAELKAGSSSALVEEVVRVAREAATPPRQLTFISFNAEVCATLKRKLPSHDVLLLGFCLNQASALELLGRAEQLGLDGIDIFANPRSVTPELVHAAHEKNMLVAVWVSQSPAPNDIPSVWAAMHASGVDMFTSNLPPKIWDWAERAGACEGFKTFWDARHSKL